MLLRNYNIAEQIVDKHIQLLDIEKHWPNNSVSVSNDGHIHVVGTYERLCFKNSYKYVIGYNLQNGTVKAFILEPKILRNTFIHMNFDNTLCLYHYRDYSIYKRFLIGSEIISWTIDWIYSYEGYLVNGNIWKGKEAVHG